MFPRATVGDVRIFVLTLRRADAIMADRVERISEMGFRTAWNLLRTTAVEWFDDDPFHLAAALAYYTLFSLGPLLLILVSLAGFILGGQAVRGEILSRAQDFAGQDAAGVIREALHNARFDSAGPFAAAVSVVVLLLGSTAVFSELQVTLNRIWDVQNPSTGAVLQMLRQRLWAIVMILLLSFLLLVSLVLETAVAAVAGHWLDVPAFAIQWSNVAVAFAVTIALFAVIYRVFPEAEVRWRDALFGAAVTAVLFAIGRVLLGLYLGWSGLGSTYGAAGSLIVLLAWLYYSSLILFLGAEFTFVLGRPDLWRDTGESGGDGGRRGAPGQATPLPGAGSHEMRPAARGDSGGSRRGAQSRRGNRSVEERTMQESLASRLALGAASGLVGTFALMGLRSGSTRWLPETLPPMRQEPGRFVIEAAESGLPDAWRERIPDVVETTGAGALALGYGVTAGVLYALLRPRGGNVVVDGTALGLGVWAAGYLGWIPALGLAPSVAEQEARQIVAPTVRHALFGIAAVAAYRWLRDKRPRPAAA